MKILVHTCCAPCLTYVEQWLLNTGFDPVSFYYNPNIYPEAEFVKRYFVLKNYANSKEIPLVFDFDKKQTEPGNCENCYKTRLRKTALQAKKREIGAFTTTLLISPYQNHEMLWEMGRAIGDELEVKFVYRDFRKGYQESRRISKELNLYRQKHCGCEASFSSRRIVSDRAQAIAQ